MQSQHAFDPSATCCCPVCRTIPQEEQTGCFAPHHKDGQEHGPTIPSHLILDRYQLLSLLGRGGFSSVYQAQDRSLGSLVAVKQISLHRLNAQQQIEATETFNREVAILSALDHPQLPSLLNHGSDAHHWYLVMQYIAGETLEQYLLKSLPSPLAHQPGLPVDEVIRLGLQLCQVLQYLHTHTPQIIFRDLKPSNIIRSSSGNYSLVDFGIARTFKPRRAHDTIPFGSPGYAAPEQYGSTQTSPRSDLYSLGVILYQSLSGQDPSQAPFQFIALESSSQEPAHQELVALIRRLVARSADQRPESARQVAQELGTIQHTFLGHGSYHGHFSAGQLPAHSFRPSPSASGQQIQRNVQPSSRYTSRRKVLVRGLLAGAALAAGGVFVRNHFFAATPTAISQSIFNQVPTTSRHGPNQPLTASNISHLHPLWAAMLSLDASDKMIVANGIVYTVELSSSGSFLVAIQDGKCLWHYQIPQAGYIADLQMDGDTIYLQREDSSLSTIYAVNAHTGQGLWMYRPIVSPIGHLACADGFLYFRDMYTVYAFDAKAQKIQWSYQFSDDAPTPHVASLVVAAGSLYLALKTSPYQTEAALVALDARTGKVQWQRPEEGVSEAFLLVENGVMYWYVKTGQSSMSLSALKAHSGKELWRRPMSLPEAYGDIDHLVLAPPLLYMKGSGHIQAFDCSTGRLAWSSGQLKGSWITIGPVVGHSLVYVGTYTPVPGSMHIQFFRPPEKAKHWLYALDAQSGQLVYMLQDDDSSFEPTVLKVENERLYVSGSRSFLGADDSAREMPNLYALGI